MVTGNGGETSIFPARGVVEDHSERDVIDTLGFVGDIVGNNEPQERVRLAVVGQVCRQGC